MTRVLLTSFEPFGGFGVNSSFEVGKAVAARPPHGVDLDWLVLPVVAWRCVEVSWKRVRETKPAVLLALGQQAGAAAVRLEEVAVNLNDFSIPDNAGNLLRKQPIVPSGPPSYRTTVSLGDAVAALAGAGIAWERSLSAGTYVCNHLFYGLLHRAALAEGSLRVGFVHLPLLPAQVKPGTRIPSRPLEEMAEGVRRALTACVAGAGVEAKT